MITRVIKITIDPASAELATGKRAAELQLQIRLLRGYSATSRSHFLRAPRWQAPSCVEFDRLEGPGAWAAQDALPRFQLRVGKARRIDLVTINDSK